MKKQLVSALLVGCLVVGCIGPVSAEEITTSGSTGETPVVLTAEAMTFSVTVPMALPVGVAADGTVSTANNAEIINNGAGPVEVKSIKVEAVAPWVLVGDFTDLSAEKVGTDKFSLQIQDGDVATDGTCTAIFDVIPAKGNITFAYKAKVAPQNEATTDEQMAKVVFTLGWQELYTPFTVTKENRSMVGYTGKANENLIIPATFQDEEDGKWYKVTSIGSGAFAHSTSLTSITIPDSVTSIGVYAFNGCTSLTSIDIPNSVTSIGNQAFWGCAFTAVEIPNSVTSIEKDTFGGCYSLTSVTIPDSVTSIGDSAFINCTSLTSVTIPNSVTSIGSQAFAGCTSLTSVTIPDSVTSIGSGVFAHSTSLTSIKWGDGEPYFSVADFETAWNTAHGTNVNMDGI